MDYLLSCSHPRSVVYFQFLHAYANGCHILSLPFVESSAKIEFEHMLRRRFMGVHNMDTRAIDLLVQQVAWIPMMPRNFFERTISLSKMQRKVSLGRRAHHLTVSIPPLPRSSALRIVTSAEPPVSTSSSNTESPSLRPAPLRIQKQNSIRVIKPSPKRANSVPVPPLVPVPAPVSAVAIPDSGNDLFESNLDTQFKLVEDCCFTLAKHEDFIFKPRDVTRGNWVTELSLGPRTLSGALC